MFSKAKLTRFNEVEGCAPPPGTYDPKVEGKLVGGVLSKTQRFPELGVTEGLSGVAAISNSTEHLPKKTPLKTPKYAKPLPRSSARKNILSSSSLTDLSKALSKDTEINKLKEEIFDLKNKLDKSAVFHSTVGAWVYQVEKSSDESIKFIIDEWKQYTDLSNIKSINDLEQELEISQNKVVEIRAQVVAQSEMINNLEEQLKGAVVNFQQLEAFMEMVNQGNNNLHNTIEELEKDKTQLQQQLLHKCDLMEEVAACEETLRKELLLTKSYGKTLEENYNIQSQEIRNMQMQIAALEELLEKKKDLESINKNLEEELSQSKEQNSLLQLNLASTESSLEIVRGEKVQLVEHLRNADEGIAAIEEQLRLKNEEFGAKIDDVTSKAQFLESQMVILQNQLKVTIEERNGLKDQVSDSEEQRTKLQEQYEEALVALTEEMKSALAGKEQISQLLIGEQSRLEELKMEVESRNALQKMLMDVRSELELKQEELNKCIESEKVMQKNLMESNRETGLVRDRIIALEERLESNCLDTEETRKILQDFSVKISAYQEQKNYLCAALEEKADELEKLNLKLDIELKAKEKLARKLNGTKSMLKSSQEKLATVENDLVTVHEKLQLSLEKESKLNVSNNELKKQVSKLEEKVTTVNRDKEKSIHELTKINSVLKREIDDVQTSLESIQFYKESIQAEVDSAVKQNEDLNKTNEKLTAQLKKNGEDLVVVQEELRGAKEHLQEHLTEANKNIFALHQQLNETQGEVISLKKESIEANQSIFELCHKLLDTEKVLEEVRAQNIQHLQKIATMLDMKEEFKEETAMSAIEKRLFVLNKYVEELEDEFAECVLLKMSSEDLLEEERRKVTNLRDQAFDARQEKEDLQMCYDAVKRKLDAMEVDKQSLEEEFSRAEKEWDEREQKLVTDINLLSDEAKEAEEKQVQYEGEMMKLKDEVNLMKEEAKWEEEKQVRLEEELAELMNEKERCIDKCSRMDREMVELRRREEEAKLGVEKSWEKVKEVAGMLDAVKLEMKEFGELFTKQDEDITLLEDLVGEKEEEMKKLRDEKEEQVRLLEGRIQDQEAAMKRLLNEVESRVQAADEMEDLLQRKISELGQSKEQIGKLEVHSKSLLDKTIVLEEREAKAQTESKKAQEEAANATRALESQLMEFSSRWSNVEDSILNLDTLESRNKELSANDSCLRSQVSILESEMQRLRSNNGELRERLLDLEKQEAKSGGHQNHLQKLSYMQHLKEVAHKHEKNEEEMHAQLVASECRVAQLESELQKHGLSAALSKSMVVEGIAASSKKSRHGKENRSLMASLSRTAHSLLSTSTPMHRKSPLQPKNN